MPQSVLRILPASIQEYILHDQISSLEEIRLRVGWPVGVVRNGREQVTNSPVVTQEALQHVLSAASGASIYTVNDSIKDGFLTIPGGHRIGVCGHAVMENGRIRTLRNFSSISIRIAKICSGIGTGLTDSTLIIGPPGCGKTTLLRDCIRILSDDLKQRVSLVDERGEVAAMTAERPQLPVGQRTDVMCFCPKALGIEMVLRSMNPQWIAVDEITREDDVEAMLQASYCGVHLLATAHAWNEKDLKLRPVYRKVMDAGVFRQILVMNPNHKYFKKRIDET